MWTRSHHRKRRAAVLTILATLDPGRPLEFAETIADGAPSPADEAIMAEEFLIRERRTPDGQFVVDPKTGQLVKEVVTLWGRPIPVRRKGKGKRVASKRAKRG